MPRNCIDFTQAAEIERWHAIDDRVMGGLSLSRLEAADEGARFVGETSLANNGGFASIRREAEPLGLEGSRGVQLVARSHLDRGYQLRLISPDLPEGAAWRCRFRATGDHWLRLDFFWHQFEAVYRGRPLASPPALAPYALNQLGLMLADRQAGPFALELWCLNPL